jgi:hypothetical protein
MTNLKPTINYQVQCQLEHHVPKEPASHCARCAGKQNPGEAKVGETLSAVQPGCKVTCWPAIQSTFDLEEDKENAIYMCIFVCTASDGIT